MSHWAPGYRFQYHVLEVAALLDDAVVVDAGLDEAGGGDEAGEAAADQGDGDVVVERSRSARGTYGSSR